MRQEHTYSIFWQGNPSNELLFEFCCQKQNKKTPKNQKKAKKPATDPKIHHNRLFQYVKKWGNIHTVKRMFFHVYLTKNKISNLYKLVTGYKPVYSIVWIVICRANVHQVFRFDFTSLLKMA